MSLPVFYLLPLYTNMRCMLYIPLLVSFTSLWSSWSLITQISNFFLVLTWLLFMYVSMKDKKSTFLSFMVSLCLSFYFITPSSLVFFISYESMLLPVLALLIIFGSEPERINSAVVMLSYTLLSSFPLFLVGITSVAMNNSQFMPYMELSLDMATFSCWAFMVKLPIWGLHSWLPLAHVFSPLSGSIFLAGALLKTGVYGLLLIFSMKSSLLMCLAMFSLAGSVPAFFGAINVSDFKAKIAFFSIMHMSPVLFLISVGTPLSISALLVISFSHGISSPLLFSFASSVAHSGTRSELYARGVGAPLAPIFVVSLFMSMGAPPGLGFLGELFMFLMTFNSIFIWIFVLLFIVSGMLSILMAVQLLSPGNSQELSPDPSDLILLLLSMPLLFSIISLLFFMDFYALGAYNLRK